MIYVPIVVSGTMLMVSPVAYRMDTLLVFRTGSRTRTDSADIAASRDTISLLNSGPASSADPALYLYVSAVRTQRPTTGCLCFQAVNCTAGNPARGYRQPQPNVHIIRHRGFPGLTNCHFPISVRTHPQTKNFRYPPTT